MKPFALLAALLASSCATAINGRFQNVPVTSTPSAAEVLVDCDGERHAAITPAVVTLRRSAESCSLTVSKPGYQTLFVRFHRETSLATLADAPPAAVLGVLGGLMGLAMGYGDHRDIGETAEAGARAGASAPFALDACSGAAFKHVPERVDVVLAPRR